MSKVRPDSTQNRIAPERRATGGESPIERPGTGIKQNASARENRRWCIKLFVQPLLVLVAGATLFMGLGIAQRYGFISSDRHGEGVNTAATAADTRYICPMMCTPPQMEPGRCPVCAMELVPAAADNGNTDSMSVQIDPAARRVANIQTASVVSLPMSRTIQAIGELSYDEGTRKTIAAYVDGRLDRLYANYAGVVVNKGDQLALVYSPDLYSGQVEFLLARKARGDGHSSSLKRVVQSSRDLYASARQRLIELGMTDSQITELEETGEANSRMHLCAPISGTVIEKLAVEGEYVREGQPICRLADLSTVWLMLELFPEDAASIRYGQQVEAEVQSLPGRVFRGRVTFIDPSVDVKTRTVGVRVVIGNENGVLRIGDYAKARIDVPLGVQNDSPGVGPELALVVPRDAVLMAGNNSVVYVEGEPGRFELRRVVLGPEFGDQIVIHQGVSEGEQVATRGNFLIDSQMQLAGNPSLIDPTKAETTQESGQSAEVIAALSELSANDRKLAENQKICPVTELPLGSMGKPLKVDVNGNTVFICCEGCRGRLLNDPVEYLARLQGPITTANHAAGQTSLPPIGIPQPIETDRGLPPIAAPQPIADPAAGGSSDHANLPPFADLPMEVVR